MNSNNLQTYLLVALLIGLICVAGYKACEIKRDQEQMAKEQAEYQQSLRDLGYLQDDSTGSQYSGEDSAYTDRTPASPAPAPTVSKDGIEDDGYTTPVTKQTATKQTPAKEPTTSTVTPPAVSAQPSSSDRIRDLDNETADDGRYRVVAGSFTKLEGARREMERLIKMGFRDAEVGRYNRGKYAVVIVKRTNDLNEANRIAEQLGRKGVDATVIDRQRKK